MTEEIEFDPITRLNRETRKMATSLDRDAARNLVDTYYRWQHQRITLNNQVRALHDANQPTGLLEHFATQAATLERQMTSSLNAWVSERPEGQWALNQLGIGPVLAAGLSAYIDIHRAPTVGHIWRFAGLDPTLEWLGREKATELVNQYVTRGRVTVEDLTEIAVGLNRKPQDIIKMVSTVSTTNVDGDVPIEDTSDLSFTRSAVIAALARRPYNAALKVLCWKIGDSFVKISNRPTDIQDHYGRVYRERKAQEVARNEAGMFAQQAAESLTRKRINDATLRRTYEEGKLPAGRLDLRARRVAVKLFLAHWHDRAFRAEFNTEPPLPYALAHLGHVHYVAPFGTE